MTDMTIANTILEQLGGNRFAIMTGARCFVGSHNSLQFRVGANDKGVNVVKIVLNGKDLYDIEFLKVRGLNFKTVAQENDVHVENLRKTFTTNTGLHTSL